MSALGLPVDLEKSEISSSLNTTILLTFLMGMYTMIYFGAVYIYFTRNFSNRRLVPATITIIFFSSISQVGVQWYSTRLQFISNGDTRDSVFMSLYAPSPSLGLIIDILMYLGFVLGDGLLIWRCYNIWNRSIRMISVPLILIVTEAGLFSADIVIHAIFNYSIISTALAIRFNDLIAVAFFTTFATSLVTTLLITYKIYSFSKQEGTSTKRFKHIIDIVVQSGALYSLSLFVFGMSIIVPGALNVLDTRIMALQGYAQCINASIPGMASTILVVRVALLAPDTTIPSTATHLSDPQCYARYAHQLNVPEMEATHPIGVDRNSVGEGQEVNRKFQ